MVYVRHYNTSIGQKKRKATSNYQNHVHNLPHTILIVRLFNSQHSKN